MTALRFDDSTVRDIGRTLTSASRNLGATTQWHAACDLGDEGLNGLLTAVRTTVNNGSYGAQTAVFALGGAATQSADAWTAADQAQAG